jgi:hypothetical protein
VVDHYPEVDVVGGSQEEQEHVQNMVDRVLERPEQRQHIAPGAAAAASSTPTRGSATAGCCHH